MTTSDKEGYNEEQQMTTSHNEWNKRHNERQWVVQGKETNDK